MRAVSVVGARPQFVKLAPLSKLLREQMEEIIIHTGQHYNNNMSETFFKELEIARPDYNLESGSGAHGKQTGIMLERLEKHFEELKPDVVIVFGDTNTTIAGALTAVKMHIPVCHVEAGLRSFNRRMPEEINRVLTDHASDLLFAPTQTAVDNLKNEGLAERTCYTGDIMVDVLTRNIGLAEEKGEFFNKYPEFRKRNYYLMTLHRPYNVDEPEIMKKILRELSGLELPIIFPVHPRTKKMIEQFDLKLDDKIFCIEPQGYLDFILLQKNCSGVITDSGGVQKEAYILKKPCFTLRTETEWIETTETGWNVLINPGPDPILKRISGFKKPDVYPSIFGEDVSEKMVSHIINKIQTG